MVLSGHAKGVGFLYLAESWPGFEVPEGGAQFLQPPAVHGKDDLRPSVIDTAGIPFSRRGDWACPGRFSPHGGSGGKIPQDSLGIALRPHGLYGIYSLSVES